MTATLEEIQLVSYVYPDLSKVVHSACVCHLQHLDDSHLYSLIFMEKIVHAHTTLQDAFLFIPF